METQKCVEGHKRVYKKTCRRTEGYIRGHAAEHRRVYKGTRGGMYSLLVRRQVVFHVKFL